MHRSLRLNLSWVCALTLFPLATAPLLAGTPIAERPFPFFDPLTSERAALAPDGKHVAFSLHRDESVFVLIINIDRPDERYTIEVGDDRTHIKTATGWILSAAADLYKTSAQHTRTDEKIAATIPYLGWPGPNRLLIANDVGEIIGVDSNGQHAGKLVDPDKVYATASVSRAPSVLELLPDDPAHVLVSAEGDAPHEIEYPSTPPALEQNPRSRPNERGYSLFPSNIEWRMLGSKHVVSIYRMNVATGKMKPIHEMTFSSHSRVIFDKEGRTRITAVPRADNQIYTYLTTRASTRSFAKIVGDDLAQSLVLAGENDVGERTFPFAFSYDSNVAYIASNVGRDTLGFYALDLTTKQRTAITPQDLKFDAALHRSDAAKQLVFDRFQKKLAGVHLRDLTPFTHWLDPELAEVQNELDRTLPAQFVRILEWDQSRSRFLVRVSNCSDAGSFMIFFRGENRARALVRILPPGASSKISPTEPFEFITPGGVHLSGYLTQPTNPRANPAPLMIVCHDHAVGRHLPAYDADIQALAAMGFVVAQVNYRGSSGFGRAHREAFVSGLSSNSDRGPIDDLSATIEWVGSQQPIDSKRVALFGVGSGSSLALRALEIEPARFRCAVAIYGPTDFGNIVGASAEKKLDAALIPTQDFAAPALLIRDRNSRPVPLDQSIAGAQKQSQPRVPAEYLEVGAEFTRRLPHASNRLFAAIQEFLDRKLYDIAYKAGQPESK